MRRRFAAKKCWLPLLTAALLLIGCTSTNSNDLTRSKSLSVLNNGTALPPQTDVPVTQDAFELAKRDGLLGSQFLELTPKGQQFFDKYWYYAGSATLKAPLKCEALEVTGITDGPQAGVKVVNFTWRYTGTVDAVNRYTGTTGVNHQGQAVMKLYDDGWRVENVDAR